MDNTVVAAVEGVVEMAAVEMAVDVGKAVAEAVVGYRLKNGPQ